MDEESSRSVSNDDGKDTSQSKDGIPNAEFTQLGGDDQPNQDGSDDSDDGDENEADLEVINLLFPTELITCCCCCVTGAIIVQKMPVGLTLPCFLLAH